MGDILNIPKHKLPPLKTVITLMKFCTTRGVAMAIDEIKDGVELQMDSVIYLDGFNKKVLEQVLDNLNMCIEKAEKLIR